MKTFLLMMLSVMIFGSVCAQNRGISITNEESQKSKFIKEGKRLRVKLESGRKINGRYFIVDESTIRIRKNSIDLDEIEKIKRNSLLLNIAINTVAFIYPGALTVGLLAWFVSEAGAVAATIGTIYAIPSVNLMRGFSPDNGWALAISM